MVQLLLNCKCTKNGKRHYAYCFADWGAGPGEDPLDADGRAGVYRPGTGDWGRDDAAEPEHASEQAIAGGAAVGGSAGAAPVLYFRACRGSGCDRSDGQSRPCGAGGAE